MTTALILSGGGGAPSTPLPSVDLVIAADSGLALAAPLGVEVDLIVGDMDSVEPPLLAEAEGRGVALEWHPRDKEATDLELAVDAAIARGATSIVIAGGGGGRLDHFLATAALVAVDRSVGVSWVVGPDVVTVVRDRHRITGDPGDTVTLLAMCGPATVSTVGLHWPLDAEELRPGSTRGVSNELSDAEAEIDVHEGAVMVITRRSS